MKLAMKIPTKLAFWANEQKRECKHRCPWVEHTAQGQQDSAECSEEAGAGGKAQVSVSED